MESKNKIQIIELLLIHSGNPNLFNETCSVPVYEAIKIKDLNAAKMLLDNGAWTNPVKQIESTGQAIALLRNTNTPPFHLAIQLSDYDMVNLFLEYGANPNVNVRGRDGKSYSPLQLAKRDDIKLLLKQHGATE